MEGILKNISIGKKLFMGFGVVITILLVLLVTTYVNLSKFSKANDMN